MGTHAVIIYLYNDFYENYLYNGFYVDSFLKLLLVWKGCFEICKYAFFNFWKGNKQKTVPGIFRFLSMLF